MYLPHVHGSYGVWKRTLDHLEMELWLIVSHHVGVRNLTQVLCKSKKLLTDEAFLQSHMLGFFSIVKLLSYLSN